MPKNNFILYKLQLKYSKTFAIIHDYSVNLPLVAKPHLSTVAKPC